MVCVRSEMVIHNIMLVGKRLLNKFALHGSHLVKGILLFVVYGLSAYYNAFALSSAFLGQIGDNF